MTKDMSPEEIAKDYSNREHASIKHRLLEEYLKALFLIIGMASDRSGVTELCYVDCFAGPWLDDSEDLKTTSIAISMAILKCCEIELQKQGKRVRFRALYVEKNRTAFKRLQQYLISHTPEGIESEALQGDFVDLRNKILNWCGTKSFAFFFIDPKGWTEVSINVLKIILERPRSEFLINFMYDFLNRAVSIPSVQAPITELLGELPNVGGLPPKAREKELLRIYRKNLKNKIRQNNRYPARSAYVSVQDPAKDRTKYDLVYLTSHPLGIIRFMEISEKLDLVQKRVRAATKQHKRILKSGQDELFPSHELIDEDEGRGRPDEVELFWLKQLSYTPNRFDSHKFADLLEETDWFPGDLQEALGRLIASGKVINVDARGKRRKHFLHHDKGGELLQLTGKVQ